MAECAETLDGDSDRRDNRCPKLLRSLRLTRRQAHILERLAELNGESQSVLVRRLLAQGLLAELGGNEGQPRFSGRLVVKS